jgi:predicted TPR repeat methyltransferase
MTTYRLDRQFGLITCTGDAINHIPALSDVEKIFENVHAMLSPGGHFVFDILNENEVSDSEPFEMDFSDTTRVWFQRTRPGEKLVNLKIRVFKSSTLAFEENIRETVHDPAAICAMLQKCGFEVIRCTDTLLDDGNHGTTWFVIARKPIQ